MTLDQQREFSIKIILEDTLTINLYEYDEYIKSAKDITDICSFLENYTDKYFFDFISADMENAVVIKKDKLISKLIKFIRNLSEQQFEKFSAIVCKSFGFTNYYATKKSHDQGVDFIAFSEFDKLKIEYRNHIIGQCKHYNNILVAVKDIRELAGSVSLFSRKEFSDASDSYFKFELGLFSPLQVIFISNYFFSGDAETLCRKASIIPLDIIDLTLLSCRSIRKGDFVWLDKRGNLNLNKAVEELSKIEIVK